MLKEKAVAALDKPSLLMPAWVKAALQANDRLKLYLTLLQSAAEHAFLPQEPITDWQQELGKVGLNQQDWLRTMVQSAYTDDQTLIIPQQEQLLAALASDLSIMARPICDNGTENHAELSARRDQWLRQLTTMQEREGIHPEQLTSLTHGNRKSGDSLHLLIMDLHKQLNVIASQIATDHLDGAHIWQVEEPDRPLIQVFMHGLHRTAPLKFSHPGLDTAATRDGSKLLIQNDIGTNDAHVLVIEVENLTISLIYSDLHASRFHFFCQMLEEIGFHWTIFDPKIISGLNKNQPCFSGNARLQTRQEQELQAGLEAIASRIVFVIDWNRARKRLQYFVSKSQAILLLRRAAQEEWGHIAWLLAGGEQLVFNAMHAVDSEAFHIGIRLDEILGDAPAAEFLLELMRISSHILLQQQPVALVADEAQMLLGRMLRKRTFEFDLLSEHAAFCHTLAMALSQVLECGGLNDLPQMTSLVLRAKIWERDADHLLMEARKRSASQKRWLPVAELLTLADDIADALEEAIFTCSLVWAGPPPGLPQAINHILQQLAETTLTAIQDQVRAIEIARHISEGSYPADSELFLQVLWRMLRAERRCDDLSRQARLCIASQEQSPPYRLFLASDLAGTIEKASDALLATGYALRQLVFTKTGMSV